MMSSVYMIVFTVGLAVQILAATGCENGTLRFNPDQHTGIVQICMNDQWNTLCGYFYRVEANVVCRQLGYNEHGATRDYASGTNPASNSYFTLERCEGSESSVVECDLRQGCNYDRTATVSCRPANCRNGSLRLVNGTSYREGRVEVCVDGRWGTVCYNEKLAGTVCQQLGFGSQGARARRINTPGHKVSCTSTTSNSALQCGSNTQQDNCNTGGLAVSCQTCTDCTSCTTASTNPPSTTGAIYPRTTQLNPITAAPCTTVPSTTKPGTSHPSTTETSTTQHTTNKPRTTQHTTNAPRTTQRTTTGLSTTEQITTDIKTNEIPSQETNTPRETSTSISSTGSTTNTLNDTGNLNTDANMATSTDSSTIGYTKLANDNLTTALSVVIGLLVLMELITAAGCILCFARKKWKTKTPPPQQRRGVVPVSYRKVKSNLTLNLDTDSADKELSIKDDGEYENEVFDNRTSNDYTTMSASMESLEMTREDYDTNDGYETMVANEGAIENFYTLDDNELLEQDHPPLVGGVSEEDNNEDYVNVDMNVLGGAN